MEKESRIWNRSTLKSRICPTGICLQSFAVEYSWVSQGACSALAYPSSDNLEARLLQSISRLKYSGITYPKPLPSNNRRMAFASLKAII